MSYFLYKSKTFDIMSIQESLINLFSFIEVYKYLTMEDFPTPGGPIIKRPFTGSNPDLSKISF